MKIEPFEVIGRQQSRHFLYDFRLEPRLFRARSPRGKLHVPMVTIPPFYTDLFEHEWIPASAHVPVSKQKLMIVLHGRGDSLNSFRTIRQELKLPNFNILTLNAPRRYLDGYSWYALEPRHKPGIEASRAKLFALVEELREIGWDPQDIFWMGHSQGCLVACDLVLNHPEAFGGLVGVSGYMWFFKGWKNRIARSGARRTPWLITHGSRDRVIEIAEIRGHVGRLMGGAVPVLYREFMKGHDFDQRREVPFIRSWIRRSREERFSLDQPL